MAALTTLDNLKRWLNITNMSDDDVLGRMIDAVSLFVENYLNRPILEQSFSEWRDGNGKSEIVLGNQPLVSVQSVTIDGRVITPADPSNYWDTGWSVRDIYLVYQNGCFSRGRNNVLINYTAGYASVPADLEQVVIDTIGLRYKERDRIGFRSKTLAGETVTFMISDFSPFAQSILRQYKKVVPI